MINSSYGLITKPIPTSLNIIRNKQIRLHAIDSIVTIDPSYNLGLSSAAIGLIFCNIGNIPAIKNGNGINIAGTILGGLFFWFTIFGAFFTYQASSLRFQFDDSSFSLVKASGDKLGENIVVGGENSWKYKSFINWTFLPNEEFPILVYFKGMMQFLV